MLLPNATCRSVIRSRTRQNGGILWQLRARAIHSRPCPLPTSAARSVARWVRSPQLAARLDGCADAMQMPGWSAANTHKKDRHASLATARRSLVLY